MKTAMYFSLVIPVKERTHLRSYSLPISATYHGCKVLNRSLERSNAFVRVTGEKT